MRDFVALGEDEIARIPTPARAAPLSLSLHCGVFTSAARKFGTHARRGDSARIPRAFRRRLSSV